MTDHEIALLVCVLVPLFVFACAAAAYDMVRAARALFRKPRYDSHALRRLRGDYR